MILIKKIFFFRRLFYSKFNKYSHPFKHKTKLLNIQEYLQILEKLRNYKFDAITYETNGYIIKNQNQINEYYTFFTNLCEKQKTQCTQDNSLDIYYSSNNYNYIAKNRKIILLIATAFVANFPSALYSIAKIEVIVNTQQAI